MATEYTALKINPQRLASAGQSLQGELPVDTLSLPTDVLGASLGVVHYRLKFGVDSENYVYIHGWMETELNLECQRCLKPIAKNMSSEFYLSPVHTSEEAGNLPERYEAVFLEGDFLSIERILEEELILNLPIAPMHSTEDCKQVVFH